MRYVILITTPDVTFEDLRERLGGPFGLFDLAPDRFGIVDGPFSGWLSDDTAVQRQGTLHYPPEDFAPTGILEPSFFTLQYAGSAPSAAYLAFLRRTLPLLANDPRVWIDNDYGLLLPGSEVVTCLLQHPDWDLGLPEAAGRSRGTSG